MKEYRKGPVIDSRIAVSTQTLEELRIRKRGGETYDTLIRRLLISGRERPITQLSTEEQFWVLQNN
jgi:hypothetical protein